MTTTAWSVYEWAHGVTYNVNPPTEANAHREAALCNEGLDYAAHTAHPADVCALMANAHNHGRFAMLEDLRRQGKLP